MRLHRHLLLAAVSAVLLLHARSIAQGMNPGPAGLEQPVTSVVRRTDPVPPLRSFVLTRQDEPAGPRSTIPGFQIGAGVGTGAVSIGDLYGLTEFSLNVSTAFSEDDAGAAFLLVQHAPVQHTSRLNASLDGGVTIVGIAGDYRFYRTPFYTFIGHYLSAGVGIHGLFWKYLHEMELPQYDDHDVLIGYERVTHDVILGFDLHGGVGIDIGQVWNAHIEGEITPGLMVWSGKSAKGFNNDLFKPFFYLKARVMARLVL